MSTLNRLYFAIVTNGTIRSSSLNSLRGYKSDRLRCVFSSSFSSSPQVASKLLKPQLSSVNNCIHIKSTSFHTSSLNRARVDYYEVLGVSRNASQKDIKKAYYQLAKKYHPDTNKDDPETAKKFQQVSEAYEILSDTNKRSIYDQTGSASSSSGDPFGGGFGSGAGGFQSTIDPEELFRKIFGTDFSRGGKNPFVDFEFAESPFGGSATSEVVLSLTFKEAARGCVKPVTATVIDTCETCFGSRCAPGYKATRCTFCNGTGMETVSTGPFVMRSTCRMCHGTRMYIKYPCPKCEGKGSTAQRKTAEVSVPAGVEDGQTMRVTLGNRELFITFKVSKSDYFRREGADVHSDAIISLSQAVLGGSIRIQGIYEDITIRVPSGTSSHTRLRLQGKGMKRVNSYGQGDHYVHFKIKVPSKLNEKQRALIQAFAETESDTPGTVDGMTDTREGK